MEAGPELPAPRGMSRRVLLRGAAIVGGTAWTLPVVQSINMSRAFAVSPHEDCFTAKFTDTGDCEQIGGGENCGVSPLTDGCAQGLTASVAPGGNWTVALPSDCRFVRGGSKCDGPTVPCESGQDNGDGTVTFFRCPKLGGQGFHDISHITLEFCCTGP